MTIDRWYETSLMDSESGIALRIESHPMSLPSTDDDAAKLRFLEGWLNANAEMQCKLVLLPLGPAPGTKGAARNRKTGLGEPATEQLTALLTAMLVDPLQFMARVNTLDAVQDDPNWAMYFEGIVEAHRGGANLLAARSLVEMAASEPYIPYELSPPDFGALAAVAGAGGGVGLGVLVAVGALSPIAFITVPAGLISFGVGTALKRRAMRLVNPVGPQLDELRRLEEQKLVTATEAADARKLILADASDS